MSARATHTKGRLLRRVALVLGAGSCGPGWGNGKAAAVAYAREGARVVATDVVLERAAETRDIIRGEGGECSVLAGDVANAADVEQLILAAVATYGRIDILHYNVGTSGFKPLTELSEAAWDRALDTNLKGAFLVSKSVMPIVLKQRGGVITTISSVASLGIGPIPFVDYYASKAALNHFTRSLAIAYATNGVRPNVIAPGLINTPLLLETPGFLEHYGSAEAMVKARDTMAPTGKRGQPGMPPMRRYILRPMRRATSTVSCCQSMVACTADSASGAL